VTSHRKAGLAKAGRGDVEPLQRPTGPTFVVIDARRA